MGYPTAMRAADLTAEHLSDPAQREQAVASLHGFLRAGVGRSFHRRLSEAELDEVAQDSVVRVLERLDGFEGRSRLSTWAMAIAVREALQRLRRAHTRDLPLEAAQARGRALLSPPEAPRRLQEARVTQLLHQGIDEVLSDAQRDALLAKLGGLTLMEIARRQGRSRGALYKSLHDGRRKLRTYLESHGVEPDALGGLDD